jgi:hypothetical protein
MVTMLHIYNQFTFRAAGKLSVFDIMLNQVDSISVDAESNCYGYKSPGKVVTLLWI